MRVQAPAKWITERRHLADESRREGNAVHALERRGATRAQKKVPEDNSRVTWIFRRLV